MLHNILTKKQIYDCLTSEIDTYNKLVSKLYTLYPDQATDIESVFDDYPNVIHNINPPGEYDAFCYKQSITSTTIISGENILVQNSKVDNGATLTLNAGTSITIKKQFVVESGSGLHMTSRN